MRSIGTATATWFLAAWTILAPRPAAGQALPELSVNDVTLAEDSCQEKNFVFTVTLTHLRGQPVTVNYATSDGSPNGSGSAAVGGKDYVPTSGTLTFDHSMPPNGPRGSYQQTIVVPLGNYVVSAASNDGRAFAVTLGGATNASISKAQGAGTLMNAALSCAPAQRAGCFVSFCGATRACKQVDRSSCSLPIAGRPQGSLESEAACNQPNECHVVDSDGDGLAEAWEKSGGVDFNCDGDLTPDEMVLTDVDPVFPDGTLNPHPSADPSVKDVFVKYDWMELPDQLSNGQPVACTLNKLAPPYNLFLSRHSDACAFDQACLAPQGSAASCDSSSDGCTCKGHTDEPSPAALKMVIDAFAARGFRLHLVKGQALAHANVTYFGVAPSACTDEFSTQNFSGTQVVNFLQVKAANLHADYNGQHFDEAHLFPIFHYALFAHRHTCDSINDCNNTLCDPAIPLFNETGRSEIAGNDMIISLGGHFDRDGSYLPDLAQAGTFMHELGHNLGLLHGGPAFVNGVPADPLQVPLNFKPNYISVMNYDFQTRGISSADPNCTPDDTLCRITPVTTRLDYSSFCPAGQIICDSSLQTIPNSLDESNGREAAGINIGNNDISYTWSPLQTPIPATGPVDFDGNGNATDTWCPFGCTFTAIDLNNDGDGKDVLLPFEDWLNLDLQFQCGANYAGDGLADGSALMGLGIGRPRELTTDQALDHHLLYPHKPVQILVLPGEAGNPGSITLAIRGAARFSVNDIDLSSVKLHGARPVSITPRDVDNDGYPDLVLVFDRSGLELGPQASRMRLTGWLKNSQFFFGEGAIKR
jgi:hypothetical protein